MRMSTRLMQSLQFTEEDLTFNRRGILSPRQMTRVRAQRRTIKFILLIVGLLLTGGGLAFLPGMLELYAQGNANWVGNAVAIGIFALFGLPLMYLGVKPMHPVKVASVKGRARVARVERTRRSNNSTTTYVATELHIADKIFTLPDAAYTELEDSAVYAVYYWDGLSDIFSLEKI
jgi:hypothetical protein